MHVGTSTYPNNNEKHQLKHRENIVKTNADKLDIVVCLYAKGYIKESERQLKNIEHSRHLEHDPTTENNAEVNKNSKMTNSLVD